MTRIRRALLFTAAILVLAAGVYGLSRWPPSLFGAPATPGRITVSCTIEPHESVLSFTQVQAPINELPFDEGAVVARDTVLARLDDRLYRQQIEIDRANLAVVSAQVAVNERTLLAAQSSVESDQFDLADKQRDSRRAEALLKTAAGSVQAHDHALTAAQQSAATLAHDQAMVQVATTNVTLARANETAAAEKVSSTQYTGGAGRTRPAAVRLRRLARHRQGPAGSRQHDSAAIARRPAGAEPDGERLGLPPRQHAVRGTPEHLRGDRAGLKKRPGTSSSTARSASAPSGLASGRVSIFRATSASLARR